MPNSGHAEAGVGEYTLPVARFLQYTHINKACIYSLEGDKTSRPAQIRSPVIEIILVSYMNCKINALWLSKVLE